jgi:hypothetical protein
MKPRTAFMTTSKRIAVDEAAPIDEVLAILARCPGR